MTAPKKIYVLSTYSDYEHQNISVTDDLEAAKLIEEMNEAEIEEFELECFEDVKKRFDEWKARQKHEEEWVLAEIEKIKVSPDAEYVSFYEVDHAKILEPDMAAVIKSREDKLFERLTKGDSKK
jgi:aconitase B